MSARVFIFVSLTLTLNLAAAFSVNGKFQFASNAFDSIADFFNHPQVSFTDIVDTVQHPATPSDEVKPALPDVSTNGIPVIVATPDMGSNVAASQVGPVQAIPESPASHAHTDTPVPNVDSRGRGASSQGNSSSPLQPDTASDGAIADVDSRGASSQGNGSSPLTPLHPDTASDGAVVNGSVVNQLSGKGGGAEHESVPLSNSGEIPVHEVAEGVNGSAVQIQAAKGPPSESLANGSAIQDPAAKGPSPESLANGSAVQDQAARGPLPESLANGSAVQDQAARGPPPESLANGSAVQDQAARGPPPESLARNLEPPVGALDAASGNLNASSSNGTDNDHPDVIPTVHGIEDVSELMHKPLSLIHEVHIENVPAQNGTVLPAPAGVIVQDVGSHANHTTGINGSHVTAQGAHHNTSTSFLDTVFNIIG